jgi:hypothetical protein
MKFTLVPEVAFCALAGGAVLAQNDAPSPQQEPTAREVQLLERIEQLEQRVAALEAVNKVTGGASTPPAAPTPDDPAATLPTGATLNFYLDGYYGYNFNRPASRVNLLRAYDALSNNFTLSQAAVVFERAPDPQAGRRLGLRLDLMFGEATETLQGSAFNEPRPQVYRNIFQAYGTYVVPLGTGLTVDFGKWASALGYEGNYAKDQINYSRSYFFNFLPFYHMGVRATYNVGSKLAVQYWLVNGANQTEDFNGFKSQNFEAVVKPVKSVSWTLNYYAGREQHDLASLQAPRGRTHIADTYLAWNATGKLLLAAEGDYTISRVRPDSSPARVTGGAGYAKYQFVPSFFLAARFEYLSDRGGLFSGVTQALKEGTLTATWQLANSFQVRGEFRRDFSNHPFFPIRRPGVLTADQNSALIALLWWFGGKDGSW